jgi:hypothetical protein
MANSARLGGSPLGLIGLKSSPDLAGRSTFNGGNSRNVIVADYNKSRAGSLFTGKRILRAWPELQPRKGKILDEKGNEVDSEIYLDAKGLEDVDYPTLNDPEAVDNNGKKVGRAAKAGKDNYKPKATLHNNTVYDTSILNIIEQLASTKAALKPADFAYLKNVGVYPNNRLMIARRFAAPSSDNIMVPKGKGEINSFATLISWVPEGQDFLDFNFGEEWTDAEADFKGILNSLGEDLKLGNLGGIAGAAGNAVPLPGFTEIFQRQFLTKLGLFEGQAASSIPAGNPNLIKQAKRRKTIGYSEAGSGLKTTINIKMTCEYELKYISGIDPTIVWMDLLSTIVRFGTSSSETYGLRKDVAAKLIGWANNPDTLIRDVVTAIRTAINDVVKEVTDAVELIYKNIVKGAAALTANEKISASASPPSAGSASVAAAEVQRTASLDLIEKVKGVLGDVGTGMVMKYRVKIIGIVNALSGLPSTPWHITIGNPMRPMFCSGDMLADTVTVKLGPQLGFNDLPSTITVDFTLTNARPLGLQEIMSKFNSGYLRTVDVQKSFYETKTLPGTDNSVTEPLGFLPLDLTSENIKIGNGATPSASTASNTGAGAGAATGAVNGPLTAPAPFSMVNPPGSSSSVPNSGPNIGPSASSAPQSRVGNEEVLTKPEDAIGT